MQQCSGGGSTAAVPHGSAATRWCSCGFTHSVQRVSAQVNKLGLGLDLQHVEKGNKGVSLPGNAGNHPAAVAPAAAKRLTSATSVPSCSEMILHTSLSTSPLSCGGQTGCRR